MRTVSACPACESSKIQKTSRALVAPFLARRIWDRKAFPTSLVRCGTCDFVFFNPRLEPGEEAKLYSGYRTPEYLAQRHALEPWYTERFNTGFMDPTFLQKRKSAIMQRLQAHLAPAGDYRILDFGGAHGELVKDLAPGSSAFVYDVSGVEPLEGVESFNTLAECRRYDFDVIVCSNVLEHVASPRTIMEQIRSVAAPNTLVWVEVPEDSPLSSKLLLRRFAQNAILLALRPRIALSLFKPGMLHWMHEHVNSFNPESLRALLLSVGMEVLACDTYDFGPRTLKMVWAVGKVSAPSSRQPA